MPRYAITKQQSGKQSTSTELYYLFELGKPLTLQTPVLAMPHRPIKNTMKLTTLTRLPSVQRFAEVENVYEEVIA